VGNALNLKAGLAKIEQQAGMQTNCLQFDDDGSLNQQIDIMLRDDHAVVHDSDRLLLDNDKPEFA
jgi:hypothetical protein